MKTNRKAKNQKIFSVILMLTMCVTLFSAIGMSGGSYIAYGADVRKFDS